MILRFTSFLIGAFLLAASCVGALAHAYLVESRPADGDLFARAPEVIELTFNESVTLNGASLVDPAGEVRALVARVESGGRIELALPAEMAQGSHLLSYRVTSQDGHVISGGFVFSLGRAGGLQASRSQESSLVLSPLSAPLVLARFLLLVGLAMGVGAALFRVWLAPARPSSALALVALAVAGLAACLSVGLQGAEAHGQPLAALNDRAMWRSGLALPQGAGGMLAIGSVAAALIAMRAQARTGRAWALLALIGAACALAWTGHARLWAPEAWTGALILVHVACALVWAGGLLPLAAAARTGDFTPVLQGFSRVAAPVFILLVLSGAALAAVQIMGPRETFETAWGVALAVKLALVAAIGMFAALNCAYFTPAVLAGDHSVLPHLRRSIYFEAALALALLGAASVWRIAPPPTALGPVNERAIQIHIHGVEAMASLVVRPARPGPVHVRIEPKRADLSPLRVQEVDLSLTPDAPGLAAIRRKARLATAPNIWVIDDLTIPAPGVWRIGVDLLIDDFERARLEATISLQP